MSREGDFAARMTGDATLMAILTGGVHQAGLLGVERITRETVAAAFDANGYLKPCALVQQRADVPTGDVVDYIAQVTSNRQIVEIWVYQDSPGYTAIDAALARLRTLFFGYQFSDTFELRIANVLDRERDDGSLAGASMARQDWQVDSIVD